MVPRDKTSSLMVYRVSQINQSQMPMWMSMSACQHAHHGSAGALIQFLWINTKIVQMDS
jgi:hypothetical protein